MPKENAVKEINKLTANLNELRRGGNPGFCLYVGHDASLTSEGLSAIDELRRNVLRGEYGENLSAEEFSSLLNQPALLEERFATAWHSLPLITRSRKVRDTNLKLSSTEGHSDLAAILKTGCFSLVITSNTDMLIEDAVLRERIPRSEWNTVSHGLHSPERIRDELLNPGNKFVILKLCGDGSASYLVSARDVAISLPRLIPDIGPFLTRPMVVTGYSSIDDCIISHFPPPRDKVYFIGTDLPPGDWNFYRHFPRDQRVDILDEDLTFKEFCNVFARRLDVFKNVEAYGMPVTPAVVEKVRGDADESEFLVELIEDEQKRVQLEQPVVAADDDEPLVVLTDSLNIFTIKYDNKQLLSFDVKGKNVSYESERTELWDVDVDELNTVMNDLGRDIATYHRLNDQEGRNSWRRRAKREGRQLYDNLMRSDESLSKQLEVARHIMRGPDVLNLNFVGPRNHLGMPYELLHDNQVPLVVKYPLSRHVSGITSRKPQKLDSFIRSMLRDKKPLRALLISSDTGDVTGDREVHALAELLQKTWPGKSEIKVLTTNEATLSAVEKLLTRCTYHLVHFAGHAQFDFEKPENSGLFIFKDKNRRGGAGLLSARPLAQLLDDSETMFFYFSCCVGAMVSSVQRLRDEDYLGVMDAAIRAGVPYVLGYRWYVTDAGSRRFASLFYQQLIAEGSSPEQATLYARSQLYGADGNDETWTSPILVSQNIGH